MNSGWAAVIVAGAVAGAGALAAVLRFWARWQRLEDRIGDLDADVKGLASDVREMSRNLARRITWVERQVIRRRRD